MMQSSSESSPAGQKDDARVMQTLHTQERGRSGYVEKGGLRTYGDDEDHEHEPPVRRS